MSVSMRTVLGARTTSALRAAVLSSCAAMALVASPADAATQTTPDAAGATPAGAAAPVAATGGSKTASTTTPTATTGGSKTASSTAPTATGSGSKAPATTAPSGGTGGSKSPASPPAPPVVSTFPDKAGTWTNFPGGAPAPTNAFFQALGTNSRTCGTCHDPKDGWTVTPGNLQKRFAATTPNGADPIFLGLDGTNCPSLPVATAAEAKTASSLLLNKGLIRVALAVPANADFTVSSVTNPYGCGSTSTVSVYRRILSTSNLAFLSTVMWDGRETTPGAGIYADLIAQANAAVATHAAGTKAAPAASIEAAVALELEQFIAQQTTTAAGSLSAAGATGGAQPLSGQAYSPGENAQAGSPAPVFTIYAAWENLAPAANASASVLAQASIGRGEKIFNTRAMSISGVTGLNDVAAAGGTARPVITGTCGTCHNASNAGSSSTGLMLDEGQAHATLRTADLPLITLTHKADGKTWQVTDPGAALTTGKWADVAKFKVPTLRGLSARAPYFHNGSAASLDQVVNFYNTRFNLNLSATEHADLVNFLGAL